MTDVIRLNLMKSEAPEQGPAGGVAEPTLQGATHAVLVVDQLGRIVDASDAACLLLACDKLALLALHVMDLIPRFDETVLDAIIRNAAAGRVTVAEAMCHRRDDSAFIAEVTVYGVTKVRDSEWHITLVLRELRLQGNDAAAGGVDARLARAERLEMAGTLAGQIAHDFNNLLTPLLAYPELIRREIPDHRLVNEYLDIMEKTATDMSRLTQQLLSLSRRGQVGNDVFNANTLVEPVVTLMQTVMPQAIQVQFDLANNLLPVKGSKDQLRRVIENLCQNAIDAMGDTGRLSIRTENVYLDAPVGQYGNVNVGEYVKISVGDTGMGIPEKVRDMIFDPFFTTKRGATHRGSGLGLSIVHGIVRDHGGYVDLDTAVGRGTTFYVYLPISRQPVSKSAGENLPHGTERILVVDDDAPQVQVLVSLLEVLGYRVTGVLSGEEAVRLVRDEKKEFDLVIQDMVLEAGMDGLDTFIELRKIHPGQRVMLISGFTKAARKIAIAQQMGAGAYLRKPLVIERVARVVRSELDAQKAGAQGGGTTPGGWRILIVDDEQMIRRLFGMIIQTEFNDAVIDQAANGLEAVTAYSQGRHDLIIMDLQMPVRDGREAFVEITRLCQEKGWAVPPVVFCTGFSPPESLNSIVGDGSVHGLLRKPVKAEALLDAIRRRLKA
jgi:signal transduction histidine kinase/CheY-like chemotaxis protein